MDDLLPRFALIDGLIGCLVVYGLHARHSHRLLIVVLSLLALFITFFLGTAIRGYYAKTGNVTVRVATWSYGLHYIEQHPSDLVLGTGFSSFTNTIVVSQTHTRATRAMSTLHSGPPQVLLELGVVGFLVYLAAFLSPILRTIWGRRDLFAATLIGAVAGIFFTEIFDNSTFAFGGVLMFGLLALLRRRLIEERTAEDSAGVVA